MEKGTKFRLPKFVGPENIISNLKEDLVSYIKKVSSKNCPPNEFAEWFESIIRKFNTFGDFRQYSSDTYVFNENVKTYLESFQNSFVITSVDKCNQNYSIICKQFYLKKLMEELGFPGNTCTTYLNVDEVQADIIGNFYKYSDELNISRNHLHFSLPFIQLIPKFHKDPISFRSIVASSRCFSKNTSRTVGRILKLVQFNLRKYCLAIHNTSGTNPFWIVSSNKEIFNELKKLSNNRKLVSINTFDFEKLYTNIDHKNLLEALKAVIKRAFGYNRKFVSCGEFSTFFTNSEIGENCFSLEDVHKMLELVINNTYFSAGNKIFKQTVGVPMGTDCAPSV